MRGNGLPPLNIYTLDFSRNQQCQRSPVTADFTQTPLPSLKPFLAFNLFEILTALWLAPS